MASSQITDREFGEIKVTIRSGMRGIKVRVKSDSVYVSAPGRVSNKIITDYLEQLRPWIREHLSVSKTISDGVEILPGKILKQVQSLKPKVTEDQGEIILEGIDLESRQIALEKFLMKKAKIILPERLRLLADIFDIDYAEAKVRKLSSRWGSCSSTRIITLNYMLATLPNELSDYVMYHEMAHLKHLNHSTEFWLQVEEYSPNYREHCAALKQKAAVLKLR